MNLNYKIMVVDDDPLIGELICKTLNDSSHFETIYFNDPTKALSKIKKLKPDMIILDWVMPQLSGLQFLLHVRRDAITKNLPVFMLTSKNKGEDFELACEANVDGYLTKPINLKSLNKRVINFFSTHHNHDTIR